MDYYDKDTEYKYQIQIYFLNLQTVIQTQQQSFSVHRLILESHSTSKLRDHIIYISQKHKYALIYKFPIQIYSLHNFQFLKKLLYENVLLSKVQKI